MAKHNIELSTEYLAVLDEVAKVGDLTSDFGENQLAEATSTPGVYKVAKYEVDGLKDYKRADGTGAGSYKKGTVKLTWETIKADYDRGAKLEIDELDNKQTAEMAFGKLNAQLIKQSVTPEGNAFTFAKIASKEGVIKLEEKTVTDGKMLIQEINKAMTQMDEAEVPSEGRILYITPTLHNLLYNEDLRTNLGIFAAFEKVVKVPQSRFYTAIKLESGEEGDEIAGGYKKAPNGKDLNFMIVQKEAVAKIESHVANNIILTENNPDSDAYICKYRKHMLVNVFDQKVKYVALSNKA